MDTLKLKAKTFLTQNKYVLWIVGFGIALMLLPAAEKTTSEPHASIEERTPDCALQLEQILSQIQGVGKVRVLLTVSEGERTLYEYDEDRSEDMNGSDLRRETVLITHSSREQDGLVVQKFAPVYQGAVVVCQGGDLPTVRLAVVEAVANATGLSSSQISVLKMK